MPGHPFTHEHRRFAIAHFGTDHHDSDYGPAEQPDGPTDDDQPVTVADLLDAYPAADNVAEWADFWILHGRADREARDAFSRIRQALHHHRALSPEERAEFDKRTT